MFIYTKRIQDERITVNKYTYVINIIYVRHKYNMKVSIEQKVRRYHKENEGDSFTMSNRWISGEFDR